MTEPAPRAEPSIHPAPLLAGVILLAIYVRIGAYMGFQAFYGEHGGQWSGRRGFLFVSDSEQRFWLAHLVLALPAALLIAWGLAPRIVPALRRLVAWVDGASPRAWKQLALAFFLVLFAWSVIGRQLIMFDRPLTDDENAVTFGARMLARGHLSVPLLQPEGAYFELFSYHHDGMVSSFDFPGVVLFAAASILTGLGSLLYALACAISGVAVAYAAGRWFGPRARVLAAIVWLASPMIASLSLTTHAHIASRMFVALALAFAARLDTDSPSSRRDALLFGACAGLGLLCRPLEVGTLLFPLTLMLTWRALRGGTSRATPLWMAVGALPALAVFAWYNLGTTGTWYLLARFGPGVYAADPSNDYSAWERIGFNLGFNLLMLAVFFLAVPAIGAVIAGIDRRRPAAIMLALGLACDLLLCLGHDNTGIHSVGPIHFSEMVVPLTVLACAGTLRGFAWLAAHRLPQRPAAVLLAGYLGLACGLFNLSNFASLRVHAEPQLRVPEALEAAGVHHAVVLTPTYYSLVRLHPTFAPWGSWVMMFAPPDPFYRDDIIYVQRKTDRAALRKQFPDRDFYSLTWNQLPPIIEVQLVEAADKPAP